MTRSPFGSVQRLGEGRYRIWWTDNGKRRSERVSGTREDAVRELARKCAGVGAVHRGTTWRRYWEDAVEPTFSGLSERTAYDYSRLWRSYLDGSLGACTVSSTTWRTVQRALDSVSAPSEQRYCYRLLKKMCNMAVRDGLLGRNPVDRGIRLKDVKRKAKATYALEEIAPLLDAIDGYTYAYAVVLEVGGGLRHEEACAVTRSDVVKVESGGRLYAVVSVSKALTLVNGRKVLKDTKTALSEREVVLGEPFASALSEDSLPESADALPSPGKVTRSWAEWCASQGLRHVTFAEMRTAYSMLHAEAKTPDVLVSLSMGHADGTTRGDNYTQADRRAMMIAADSLTDALEAVRCGAKWCEI